jgi:hypothetical protein
LYNLHTDFKQAFGTVNREKILQKLQGTGIPNKLIRIVKMTIQHKRASVIAENLRNRSFGILS